MSLKDLKARSPFAKGAAEPRPGAKMPGWKPMLRKTRRIGLRDTQTGKTYDSISHAAACLGHAPNWIYRRMAEGRFVKLD